MSGPSSGGFAVGAVLALGLVALALTGLGVVAGVAAVGCAVAPWLRRRPVPWGVVTGGVVTSLIVAWGLGAPPPVVLGGLLAYLQVHRRATRTSAVDDRMTLLLSGLMLVASGGSEPGPGSWWWRYCGRSRFPWL